MEKLRRADCLILTSSVYALQVSGLIKSFFDLTAYRFHRPAYFDKKALVLSSTAGGAAKKACRYMRDTLMHWGFNRVNCLPVIRTGATEPDAKVLQKCREAAGRLYGDTASGRLRAPSLKRVFYYQLWRAMSLSREGADRDYWAESGLARHAFAPGVPLGPAKKLYGKAVFAMLKKMMG